MMAESATMDRSTPGGTTIVYAGNRVRVSSRMGIYAACAFLRLQCLAREAWLFLHSPAT